MHLFHDMYRTQDVATKKENSLISACCLPIFHSLFPLILFGKLAPHESSLNSIEHPFWICSVPVENSCNCHTLCLLEKRITLSVNRGAFQNSLLRWHFWNLLWFKQIGHLPELLRSFANWWYVMFCWCGIPVHFRVPKQKRESVNPTPEWMKVWETGQF